MRHYRRTCAPGYAASQAANSGRFDPFWGMRRSRGPSDILAANKKLRHAINDAIGLEDVDRSPNRTQGPRPSISEQNCRLMLDEENWLSLIWSLDTLTAVASAVGG
jgi:hypothetical protein